MRFQVFTLVLVALVTQVSAKYWMEEIHHQGISPFHPDENYPVFRSVKDFGAAGDGVADDTLAINSAIAWSNRCGGATTCQGSTISPAVVYFPKGTYLVSSSIISYYYTQLIGDPTSRPIIKASKDFKEATNGVIETNPYVNGRLKYMSTNNFFRQIRNFVIDTRDAVRPLACIHWPAAQATSIQNVAFVMASDPARRQTGIFMEEGSGGLLVDLEFWGGEYGAQLGNQQYTARNLAFHGCQTAILQIWDWGWTYKSISINNCKTGINMSDWSVGSVTLLDSEFNNVDLAIITGRDPASSPKPGAGSLIIDNTKFQNVNTILKGPKGTVIEGVPTNSITKKGFGHGHLYAPYGPHVYQASDSSYFPTPPALMMDGKYYERSKPQYETTPASAFLSARDYGAKGDSVTDDTDALNKLFKDASEKFDNGAIAYLDAGQYKVTDTVFFPPNLRVVGEALASIIMAAGDKFSDINKPYPVVRVGNPGDKGYLEWSETLVSTQGAMAGAVLIEYNLATDTSSKCKLSPNGTQPSGMWDVHTRIGGFAGSQLQVVQCPKTPNKLHYINPKCIAAYMACHITKSATGLYLENAWFWVADHDIEDNFNTQIAVFAGRGLLVESERGRIWLVGTASEHFVLYQYQLLNTRNMWIGQIQTESAYHQPNPPAPFPFIERNETIRDPDFQQDCRTMNSGGGGDGNEASTKEKEPSLTYANLPGKPPCEMGWGLRILASRDVVIYGAGLYSFFNNWTNACAQEGFRQTRDGQMGKCQARIFYIEGEEAAAKMGERDDDYDVQVMDVSLFNLNTVGVVSMINREGTDVAYWGNNKAGFTDTVAMFKFWKQGNVTATDDDNSSGSGSDGDYGASGDTEDDFEAADGFADARGRKPKPKLSVAARGGDGAFPGTRPGQSLAGSMGFAATDGEAGYVCFGDWKQLCGRAPRIADRCNGFGVAAEKAAQARDDFSGAGAADAVAEPPHPGHILAPPEIQFKTVTVTQTCEPYLRVSTVTVADPMAMMTSIPPELQSHPDTTMTLVPAMETVFVSWQTAVYKPSEEVAPASTSLPTALSSPPAYSSSITSSDITSADSLGPSGSANNSGTDSSTTRRGGADAPAATEAGAQTAAAFATPLDQPQQTTGQVEGLVQSQAPNTGPSAMSGGSGGGGGDGADHGGDQRDGDDGDCDED